MDEMLKQMDGNGQIDGLINEWLDKEIMIHRDE